MIFSRESANNVVENNVISNPVLRYNIEDWELTGGGNVARRNCVWSTRHQGNGGIQPGLEVATLENKVDRARLRDRGDKDFRLRAGQPVPELRSQPAARRPRSARRRGLRRAAAQRRGAVWPGGRLRLRAKVVSKSARASASKRAVLKVRAAASGAASARCACAAAATCTAPQLGQRRARACAGSAACT